MQGDVDLERETSYERTVQKIVLDAVGAFDCEVFLFGSRARGEVRRSSDFDIGIRGLEAKAFREVKRRIDDAMEAGNVPHDVDVVDFDRAEESFRAVALKDTVQWKSELGS